MTPETVRYRATSRTANGARHASGAVATFLTPM